MSALWFTYDTALIDSIRRQIVFRPDAKRALFLAERSRADFVYNTAALEGNPFTYPEVKTLLEGITVGGHRLSDTEQVLRLNRALSHVIRIVADGSFRIDAKTACQIQGIVAENEALTWWAFRTGGVGIGGTEYKPPKAELLPQIFHDGQSFLKTIDDPILRAFLVFLWGSLHQFFYDGNKRTARFLANGNLLSAGFPPLVILAKDQLLYNQLMTRFYDTQEASEVLEWLYSYYSHLIAWLGFSPSSL